MCIRDRESALLEEHARAGGLSAGTIAFDCSKRYDRVDLRKAAVALKEEAFPDALAGVAMAQYYGPRAVCIGSAVSSWRRTAR
eukprot:11819209-Alexandrium_andersonii.AAC.1